MSAQVKCFKLLGFDGVESNGGGFVFMSGFVSVVNESLEIFCVSDLVGK